MTRLVCIWNIHTISVNHDKNKFELTIQLSTEGLGEVSDIDFFF